MKTSSLLLLSFLFFSSCIRPDFTKQTADGYFSFLTYNIAGLPQGLSSSNPSVNIPQISPRLNNYDIVLMQEDFSYHWDVIAKNGQPYISQPSAFSGLMGDGLNRLSYCKFTSFYREPWALCSGFVDQSNDCLTLKGFSFGRHYINSTQTVDIYNLHMDAGGSAGDNEARMVQTYQLIDYVLYRSAGRAVIIAGDFNMRYSDIDDDPNLTELKTTLSLIDSAEFLGIFNDRIDKIFYRSTASVILTPQTYSVETVEFSDSSGNPLSDHEPIEVLFKID